MKTSMTVFFKLLLYNTANTMKVVKINNIKMKSVESEQIYIYAYIINYFLFLSFTSYWKVYCIILNCL